MTKLEKDLIKKFGITEDEYWCLRQNLRQTGYITYKNLEEFKCLAWYFDGDEGMALIKHCCNVHEVDGFTIQLIECNHCDIDYDAMESIIEEFKIFDHEYNKYMDEQEALEEQKLNSDRYKKALYMDDSDDEYHEEYANM